MKKIRVMHLITGLNTGGAEHMLHKLLLRSDRTRFEHNVVSMIVPGAMAPPIAALGIQVRALDMKNRVPDPRGLFRLMRWLAAERPHMLQTWMLHADLLGAFAGVVTRVPTVWNIRHGVLDPEVTPLLTQLTERAGALLSRRLPRRVVCCAEEARRHQIAVGYHPAKLLVIPNGFDMEAFRPDPGARASVRFELGLSADAALVGVIARYDPHKDHANLLHAAARVNRSMPRVHFVLCGQGVDDANATLRALIAELGLGGVVHLLGRRTDVARIDAALDVLCSSSISEGFPNVVGEAMACGIPCVVTDVGDSALIVGDAGWVVPSQDPVALADALLEALALDGAQRERIAQRARARVREHFDLPVTVAKYEALYTEIACAG